LRTGRTAPRPRALCSPISTVDDRSIILSFRHLSEPNVDALEPKIHASVFVFEPSGVQTDRTEEEYSTEQPQ